LRVAKQLSSCSGNHGQERVSHVSRKGRAGGRERVNPAAQLAVALIPEFAPSRFNAKLLGHELFLTLPLMLF